LFQIETNSAKFIGREIVKRAEAEIIFEPPLSVVRDVVSQNVYDCRANPDNREASYFEKDRRGPVAKAWKHVFRE
jgi:hypothetical protein